MTAVPEPADPSLRGLEGEVDPAFRQVAEVFRRTLPRHVPAGAALTVYHRGESVVDIWGGRRSSSEPWQSDTMATSFSTSKGVVSTLLHLLAERGLVDYRTPVSAYWPEFAQARKQRISIRTLMSHEAGLYDVRSLVPDATVLNDWERTLTALEEAEPVHRPGARHGYHAWTYGYLVGGLIERVTGKRLSEVLHEELTEPLGLDGAYFGAPSSDIGRLADLVVPRPEPRQPAAPRDPTSHEPAGGALQRLASSALESQTRDFRRALMPRGMRSFDLNSLEFRAACNPSAGGVFTARSLARVYAMIAEGGTLDGRRYLGPRTLTAMATRQSIAPDAVLRLPMHWRLGYHRVFALRPTAPNAFGHFGYGGSGRWADPSRRLSLAYTCNSGSGSPVGDLRIMKLTTAALRAADSLR